MVSFYVLTFFCSPVFSSTSTGMKPKLWQILTLFKSERIDSFGIIPIYVRSRTRNECCAWQRVIEWDLPPVSMLPQSSLAVKFSILFSLSRGSRGCLSTLQSSLDFEQEPNTVGRVDPCVSYRSGIWTWRRSASLCADKDFIILLDKGSVARYKRLLYEKGCWYWLLYFVVALRIRKRTKTAPGF